MRKPSGRSSTERYCVFETPIGPCGVAWSERGVTRLQLPEADRAATERRVMDRPARPEAADPAGKIKPLVGRLQRYLTGNAVDFSSVPLDLNGIAPFHQKVYEAARSVSWGQTASYGDLARLAGSPGAARAVGQALARNPVAIIIPCHRILASGNKVGGFSAYGGIVSKERLLALEGVLLGQPQAAPDARSSGPLDVREAVRFLSAVDPKLGAAIKEIGPWTFETRRGKSPFERLAEAIVHQQLSTKAAATIMARVHAALGGSWSPEALIAAASESLRGCGLSQAKLDALRDLAQKSLDGTIAPFRSLEKLSDDEIIERVTSVKGIGVWTAQMFLIFALGRPDVMPANDFGLRRGFQIAFGMPEMPTPTEILERAESWRPYCTVASWYLWRVADRAKARNEEIG